MPIFFYLQQWTYLRKQSFLLIFFSRKIRKNEHCSKLACLTIIGNLVLPLSPERTTLGLLLLHFTRFSLLSLHNPSRSFVSFSPAPLTGLSRDLSPGTD